MSHAPRHPANDWFGYSLIVLALVFTYWALTFTRAAGATPLKPLPARQYVSVGVLQPEPWHPTPGQHNQPPEGWFCTNDPRGGKDHQCSCEHKCVPNQPSEDPETGVVTPAEPGNHIEENAKCSSYCFPKHCACDVKGCQST